MSFLAQDLHATGIPQVSGIWVPQLEPELGDCPEPHIDIGEEGQGREAGREETGGRYGVTVVDEGAKRMEARGC